MEYAIGFAAGVVVTAAVFNAVVFWVSGDVSSQTPNLYPIPHTRKTHPKGRWVPAANVDPIVNVHGREARFENGLTTVHWLHECGKSGPITHWWFADEVDDDEVGMK